MENWEHTQLCCLGRLPFFPIYYIQTLAHRTCEMHAKQALYAYSRHDLVKVKDVLNLPDFPIAVNFPGSF